MSKSTTGRKLLDDLENRVAELERRLANVEAREGNPFEAISQVTKKIDA